MDDDLPTAKNFMIQSFPPQSCYSTWSSHWYDHFSNLFAPVSSVPQYIQAVTSGGISWSEPFWQSHEPAAGSATQANGSFVWHILLFHYLIAETFIKMNFLVRFHRKLATAHLWSPCKFVSKNTHSFIWLFQRRSMLFLRILDQIWG